MRRPRTEARAGDWMTQEGLTNRGPLQKPILCTRTHDLKASFCEARSSVLRAPSSQIGWDDDAVDALGVNGSGSVGIIAPLLMVQTVAA